MKSAYLRWQAQESRLVEARQRLDRQYLALGHEARQVQIEAQPGILRAARSMLDQPLDPMTLKVKTRLVRVFDLWGQGFCRRMPLPLEVDLSQYIARMEKISRSHGELEARLRLAQAIMGLFVRHPEFCRAHWFRLALTSPESAWLLFHLRRKRLQERHTGLRPLGDTFLSS